MVGDEGHVGRKKCLVAIMNAHRNVRPPQKSLGQRSAIVETDFGLHDCFAGRKMDADHAFHPQHGIVFAQPYRAAAVGMLLDGGVNRHIRGRPMMLRPVELDASGYPGAKQSHQRRLDHVLAVEKIVTIGLVEAGMNAASDFGKKHQLDEFVLEENSLISGIYFFKSDAVSKRIGINLPAASLVNPLFEKHGIGVGFLNRISGNRHLLFPAANRSGFTPQAHHSLSSAIQKFVSKS